MDLQWCAILVEKRIIDGLIASFASVVTFTVFNGPKQYITINTCITKHFICY
ncbi:hypothetical protein Hanom_Chr02g00170381 [Helianthus anomalus]